MAQVLSHLPSSFLRHYGNPGYLTHHGVNDLTQPYITHHSPPTGLLPPDLPLGYNHPRPLALYRSMSASTSRLTQAVRPASFRILQPRVLSGRVPSLPLRTISTSSPRGTVSDSISSVVQRMRELVAQERKGWVEGDQEREKGLRMLMFGKPGSGKVRCSPRIAG